MPVGKHSILFYFLGDKNLVENPAAIHREALILQKKEIVVQLLNSEFKKNKKQRSIRRKVQEFLHHISLYQTFLSKSLYQKVFPQTPPL